LLIVYAHNHDDDEESILPRKNQLCEVKYRKDLALQWPKLKPKIRAARKYAKNEGWEFKIFTEKEIRTPYLENIRFLWSYRFSDFDEHHYEVKQHHMISYKKLIIQKYLEVKQCGHYGA